MTDNTIVLLRELTEAHGISGYEQEVREIIRKHLHSITVIEQDRLGSQWALARWALLYVVVYKIELSIFCAS